MGDMPDSSLFWCKNGEILCKICSKLLIIYEFLPENIARSYATFHLFVAQLLAFVAFLFHENYMNFHVDDILSKS